MPKKDPFVEFRYFQKQFKVAFVTYADFEAILKPAKRQVKPLTRKEPYTKEINQHIPSDFCVYSKFAYGEVKNPLKLYRGGDGVELFCDYIINEAKRLYHMFPEKLMEPLTPEQ